MGWPFTGLNRFEEAKEICERALTQKLDAAYIRGLCYQIAFVQGDTAAMRTQIDWASGKPEESAALGWQARAAAFSGQLRRAHEFSSRATILKMGQNVTELAAGNVPEDTLRNAVVGNCQRIREDIAKALSIGRSSAFLSTGARALALCGEVEFQKILDHRGWDALSPLYPLAHLRLARAAALQGDMAKARKSYQDFLALWKDADADLPILIEAKKECEKLK